MEHALQLSSINLPIGSIDAYIYRVNQIPLLTHEEEIHYARRLQEDGDLESARHLVLSHLRYVVRVARGYLGYGLPLNDLIQEGSVGLMKAVKRFDPNVGVRLVSFAVHWIKSEIHEFIIKNWRIVKIATTKSQRKLFFNLREMKARLERLRDDRTRLGWMSREEIASIAEDLGVSAEDVLLMEQRLNGGTDVTFDVPEGEEDDGRAPISYLQAEHADPALIIEREITEHAEHDKLTSAFSKLDERSQEIIRRRWLLDDKSTLHEMAEELGITAERVRQLEKNAMKKLKNLMECR